MYNIKLFCVTLLSPLRKEMNLSEDKTPFSEMNSPQEPALSVNQNNFVENVHSV